MKCIFFVSSLMMARSSLSFSVVGSRENLLLKNPTRVSRPFSRHQQLFVDRISWSEYKHDFIDPIVPHAPEEKERPGMSDAPVVDKSKRQVADEFWLAQFEDEKKRLNEMMNGEEAEPSYPVQEAPKTSYEQYRSTNIDPIASKHHERLMGHMDASKREAADEFWLQSFLWEKERLEDKDLHQ